MPRITPCLWFNSNAEEAVQFYLSVFPNSRIVQIARYSAEVSKVAGFPEGAVMTVAFELDGCPFLALNGGPQYSFSAAISHIIHCDSQEEIDHYWDKLSEGGNPSQCGWLDDKFGVTWQVVPTAMTELMNKGDAVRTAQMMEALMPMTKLDTKTLREAYDQN